ncbi:hypothetical protein HO133_005288 [Letharia lupina]|uniref:Regulator of volume decrease after cellular swelling-domain-containing protein n=1 Tax=Letharia lupina TaxID=560253 RepID=A0A8H6C8P8_9LECA|nr:uncharacterized protein HO133_005288 [Letharia lupina]KAF6218746.1 hypothetical protein HO133_005288 [Letharia lupina]
MEIIHQSPTSSSFTPLAVHQSQTPDSFYSGPAVLYHHSPSASLLLHASDLAAAPALAALANGAHRSANGTATVAVNGHDAAEDEDEDEEFEIAGVDVWVTSERFILYSPTLSTGLSIPYPSISLHAVQRPSHGNPASLFLQLLTEAPTFDDHDPDSTISMTIVPAAAAAATTSEDSPEQVGRVTPESESQARRLYAALSACANLHPDPASGSEGDGEDGEGGGGQRPAVMFEGDQDVGGVYPLSNGEGGGAGLPPPMPGSGVWITAENMGEFFDDEGNWRGNGGAGQEVGVSGGAGGLGEGAGTVRTREEDVDGEDAEGEGEGSEETKWRRTD